MEKKELKNVLSEIFKEVLKCDLISSDFMANKREINFRAITPFFAEEISIDIRKNGELKFSYLGMHRSWWEFSQDERPFSKDLCSDLYMNDCILSCKEIDKTILEKGIRKVIKKNWHTLFLQRKENQVLVLYLVNINQTKQERC